MIELTNIYMTTGVNEKGDGFITIAAHGSDGTMMVGQLPPEAMRAHGSEAMAAAEAAEQDAAVRRCVRKLELPDELAGAIITELRESRAE